MIFKVKMVAFVTKNIYQVCFNIISATINKKAYN